MFTESQVHQFFRDLDLCHRALVFAGYFESDGRSSTVMSELQSWTPDNIVYTYDGLMICEVKIIDGRLHHFVDTEPDGIIEDDLRFLALRVSRAANPVPDFSCEPENYV